MNQPTTSKNTKANIPGSVADILSVGAIYLVAQIVVALCLIPVSINNSDELDSRPGVVLMAYIVAGITTLGLTLGMMKLRRINFNVLSLHKYHIKDLGYALVGYIVYMVLTILITSILRLLPGLNLDQEQDLGLQAVTDSLLPLTFVALVIVPPIVEEILFRGFLYGRLKYHRYTRMAAALITSVAFGLVHGQLNVAIDTFILSMVMIFMLEKRKNLWVTITMHALKNSVAFFALFVFKIV